jgi:hypothetical protein
MDPGHPFGTKNGSLNDIDVEEISLSLVDRGIILKFLTNFAISIDLIAFAPDALFDAHPVQNFLSHAAHKSWRIIWSSFSSGCAPKQSTHWTLHPSSSSLESLPFRHKCAGNKWGICSTADIAQAGDEENLQFMQKRKYQKFFLVQKNLYLFRGQNLKKVSRVSLTVEFMSDRRTVAAAPTRIAAAPELIAVSW